MTFFASCPSRKTRWKFLPTGVFFNFLLIMVLGIIFIYTTIYLVIQVFSKFCHQALIQRRLTCMCWYVCERCEGICMYFKYVLGLCVYEVWVARAVCKVFVHMNFGWSMCMWGVCGVNCVWYIYMQIVHMGFVLACMHDVCVVHNVYAVCGDICMKSKVWHWCVCGVCRSEWYMMGPKML